MGKNNRKIKGMLFFKYVVKKPIVCIAFFVLFFVSLLFMFSTVKVSVYNEYEVKNISSDKIVLESEKDIEFIEETTIVYYKDRNNYIYTSDDYNVENNTIEILDSKVYLEGTIYIFVEVEKKSLGKYIIDGSFNY